MDVGIVFCAERPIEREARLLVRSLREFGGAFAEAPLYAYSPRPDRRLGADARAELLGRRTTIVEEPLNRDWPDYPLVNKPLAMAHAEANLPHDILVFLDTDMVIVGEPRALDLPPDIDIAISPVFHRGIGIAGAGGAEREYWRSVSKLMGYRLRRRVVTVCDRYRILEYYNSGMFGVRRDLGAMRAWLDAFRRIAASGTLPKLRGLYYVEQSALTAVIGARNLRIELLPADYNLPLHLPCVLRFADEAPAPRVSLHYGTALGDRGWRKWLSSLTGLAPADRLEWLIKNLKELGF